MELEDVFLRFRAIKNIIPLHHRTKSIRFGERPSPFKGPGYDITDIRELRPGEPATDIAVRVSIRNPSGKIFKFEKIEPKAAPVIIIADISPSMLFKIANNTNKAKLLFELIGIIGLTSVYFSDPVGLVAFSDRIDISMLPKTSKDYVFFMVKELFKKIESPESYLEVRNTSLIPVIDFLKKNLTKQHCLIFLSDFIDQIEGKENISYSLKELSVKHSIFLIFLDDPEEFQWKGAKGIVAVKSLETGEINLIKASKASKVRQRFVDKRCKLIEELKDIGIHSLILSYGGHFSKLAQFFAIQQKIPKRHRT